MSETMRALRVHAAHDIRVDELPIPEPGPGEVDVAIEVGGICGSDLHYFQHGGINAFPLREPMTLGHEVVGRVARTGAGVTGVREGDRVAVHPARPCGACEWCTGGRPNICPETRFLGSAMRFPHVQGGFAERLVVSAAQCVPIPDGLASELAVFAEPLAVGIHAATRAGDLHGKSVLVTGAGPIGILAVVAARWAGAARVIVTDLVDEPLAVAREVGATDTIRVGGPDPVAIPEVDVALEMSGSAPGTTSCLEAVRRGGRIVLVGIPAPGPVPAPLGNAVMREIDVVGSFRYGAEFAQAVAAIAGGAPVAPLRSASFGLAGKDAAFALALDRTRAMKVQLDFREP
jgi:L-idonate 5-dehydrogenase